MKRWTPLLFGSELSLVILAGLWTKADLFWLFLPKALFIYLMTGGLLFYQLLFEEVTKKQMLRKQSRRWIALVLIAIWYAPLWIPTAFALLFTFRALLTLTFMLFKKKGWNQRRLAIIGSPHLAESLNHVYWSGYKVVAIDPQIEDLEALHVEELWIAYPLKEMEKAAPILDALSQSTLNIKLIPDLAQVAPVNVDASMIGRLVAIHVRDTPIQGVNRVIKCAEDRILAMLILIFVSPIMLITALLVKLSSPGPIFYRQERVSWNGKPFHMLKFRTMPVAAEATTGPVWASSSDTRTTFIGKFLRRTCIDELPQFFNVLKGEMSIVGPRPERPHFINQFKNEIPRYMQKHMVKAGITGLAQIRGFRGQTDLNKRIQYDLQYIHQWSLWLDLKIIALTLIKGFKNAY